MDRAACGPAEAAGISIGERVLRVRGITAGPDGKPLDAELAKPPGTKVELEVARRDTVARVFLILAEPFGAVAY